MKKSITLRKIMLQVFFVLSLSFGLNAQSIVTNGDFESWTGGLPDGWTTIDAGITVTQETATIHGGASSASIDVLTGTQGDTDFRQNVSVVAGTTYDVSVWVYHTEGNVKARLYVGTYLQYSDNTITGSWQEMTYTYSAGTTGDIEIGLRFYDQAGFDGAEIVYVDDFTMTPQVSTSDVIYLEGFESNLGETTQFSAVGAEAWEWANYGLPPGCSVMNGYNSGAQDNEDWLITNAIDCSNYTNISLRFDHARNYADNTGLYVMISTDYDGSGDPNSFTWTDLTSSFTFPTGGWTFIDAGSVDITANAGSSTYIAFKYTSTTADAATWEVDNITVDGEFNISASIAGSFNGWNSSDPDYQMEINSNGIFELTKSLAAGTHEYKVVEDGNWYPGNNQTFTLAATEDVTWKYNFDANIVTHDLPVVAGNFLSAIGGNDWDPTELMGEMSDPEGDDIFTLELVIPAGSYECKVTLNHNWDQSTGGNVPFTTDGVAPTIFTYDFTTNTTTVTGPPPPSATVTFIVDDSEGQNYEGFFLKGSWDDNGNYDPSWNNGNEHSAFYDDGTNGDVTAGDHIWTCQQDLTSDGGSNTWEWGVNDAQHQWAAGNWTFQVIDGTEQTLTWSVPTTPSVVINEIMYNSIGTDEEWVELYNPTDAAIDLENWKLLDSDSNHTPIVITSGYSIPPYGYFTIQVTDGGAFPFTPDFNGAGAFGLNNGDDNIRMYNGDGILIDRVHYYDGGEWPSEADGDGPSLSLFDPATDNALGANWMPSTHEGGSPGSYNFPIQVLTPNGGEVIETGSTFDITWEYHDFTGDIKIELIKEGEVPELLVSGIPATDGSFSWYVFESLVSGADYKMLISSVNDGGPLDWSNDYFTITEPYIMPELVFTEIMYNPPEAGDDSLEFVEIYNKGAEAINLNGFYFSQGVEFVFPDVEVLPESYILVAKNANAFENTFGATALEWTSGSLSNGGESVELKDALDNVIDLVDFDDYLPWDTLADGYGPSLTLCNPNVDNNVPENWTHSVYFIAENAAGDSIWATPGFGCAISLLPGFEADITQVVLGGSVNFTDLTLGDPISWLWTFEGGTPETFDGQTPPPITYDTEGNFDVTLYVSDGNGEAEITYQDYIEVINLAPPTNLMAEVGPFDDVQLTWNSPGANELIYDNDVVTGSYRYEGYTMSTHMSPTGPCKILSLKYYTTIEDGDNTFNANIYAWDGTQPATDLTYTEAATAVGEDWVEVDVSSQDINFTGDFVVGFGSINATTYLGYDANLDNGRSWDFDNVSEWTSWNEAYVIRAVVEYTDGKIVEIGNVSSNVQIDRLNFASISHPVDYSNVSTVEPINALMGGSRALLGFNVYRDDVQINTATVTETEYNDPEPTIGSHDYYVTAVYDEGQSGPSNVVSVVVTDINEITEDNISVYPNPSDGMITIEIAQDVEYNVKIMDIRGKLVYENNITNSTKVNLAEYRKGIYLISLIDKASKDVFVKKLIVR